MLTRKQRWLRVQSKKSSRRARSTSPDSRIAPGSSDAAQALLLLEALPRINKWDPIFWRGWGRDLRVENRRNSWPRTRQDMAGGGRCSCFVRPEQRGERSLSMSSSGVMAIPEAVGKERVVRFDQCVRVLLVPSRRDLNADTCCSIWWGSKEINEFRAAAYRFWKVNGKLNIVTKEELEMSGPVDCTVIGEGVANSKISSPAASSCEGKIVSPNPHRKSLVLDSSPKSKELGSGEEGGSATIPIPEVPLSSMMFFGTRGGRMCEAQEGAQLRVGSISKATQCRGTEPKGFNNTVISIPVRDLSLERPEHEKRVCVK